QFGRIEIVTTNEQRLRILRVAGVGFEPGVRRFAEIARKTDDGKIVIPVDRDERNHAADAAVILHDDTPPFTAASADDAGLMQRQAAAGIGIAVSDGESLVGPAAVGSHTVLTGDTQRLASHHAFDLPRTID